MDKKTTITVLLAIVLIGIAGWLLYPKEDRISETSVMEPMPTDNGDLDTDPTAGDQELPEIEFDNLSDETRIILAKPDEGELSDLLSEKVIRNDKIVDKNSTEEIEK